jgi:hypothetical protein
VATSCDLYALCVRAASIGCTAVVDGSIRGRDAVLVRIPGGVVSATASLIKLVSVDLRVQDLI